MRSYFGGTYLSGGIRCVIHFLSFVNQGYSFATTKVHRKIGIL